MACSIIFYIILFMFRLKFATIKSIQGFFEQQPDEVHYNTV